MALNQQMLQGHWNEIKGKLHERWGELTDDELGNAKGNVEQLVGTIQRRTGESRESIEGYLEELASSAGPMAQRATEALRGYAGHAAESISGAAQQASESMQMGYDQTKRMVRRHPLESLATCFGVGLITGVVIGFMVRSK